MRCAYGDFLSEDFFPTRRYAVIQVEPDRDLTDLEYLRGFFFSLMSYFSKKNGWTAGHCVWLTMVGGGRTVT